MPASCSAASPASRARWLTGRSCSMPKRTMPMPATATPSKRSPRLIAALRRRPSRDRSEPVDHDLVARRVGAQRLEVDLDLHADGEVAGAAEQDRLHPGSVEQVDLGHAVALDVGVLLPEQRDVAVGPGVDAAPGRQLDVVGALVQALGAHQAAGEEHLAARRAPAAQQARQLGGVVGDPEEPFLDGDAGHVLLGSDSGSDARWSRGTRCAPGPASRDRGDVACRASRWGRGAWRR